MSTVQVILFIGFVFCTWKVWHNQYPQSIPQKPWVGWALLASVCVLVGSHGLDQSINIILHFIGVGR